MRRKPPRDLGRCLDPNTCGGNLRVIWVAVLKRCSTCGVGSDGFPIRDPYPSSGSPFGRVPHRPLSPAQLSKKVSQRRMTWRFPHWAGDPTRQVVCVKTRQGKPQDHWAGHKGHQHFSLNHRGTRRWRSRDLRSYANRCD
jgi:hypothetical protein